MSESTWQDEGTRYEVATEILRALHADAMRRWQSAVGDARQAAEELRQHRTEADRYWALRRGLHRASAAEVEQLIAQYGPQARSLVAHG